MPPGKTVRATSALVLACGLLVGCGFPSYVYVDTEAGPLDDGSTTETGTNDSTAESGTDADVCTPNECGGCATVGVKGGKCGTCGQYQCDGTDVTCVESMPAPGATCGVCHTSMYTCNAINETVCASSDDRVLFEDINFSPKDLVVYTLDHTTELVATYASTKAATYHDAAFVIRRIDYVCPHVMPNPDSACKCTTTDAGFDCKVPSTLVADVTVTLYTGSPATTLTPIATGKITNASTIGTAPALTTFTFQMEAPPVPVGTQMSVGISTTSTAYAFEISGAGSTATAPAKMSWFHRNLQPTPGTFKEETASHTALVVHGKACP